MLYGCRLASPVIKSWCEEFREPAIAFLVGIAGGLGPCNELYIDLLGFQEPSEQFGSLGLSHRTDGHVVERFDGHSPARLRTSQTGTSFLFRLDSTEGLVRLFSSRDVLWEADFAIFSIDRTGLAISEILMGR